MRLFSWAAPLWRDGRVRVVLLGVAGALAAVHLFSPLTFSVGALRVQIALHMLDGGHTVIALPPLGAATAHTDAGPLGVTLTLVGLDLSALERVIATSTRAEVVASLLATIRRDVALAAAWTALLAMAGGALLPLAAGERRAPRLLGGAAAGLGAVGSVIVVALLTFRVSAFQQPSYSGVMQAAPTVAAIAEQGFGTIRSFESQMGLIAGNLNHLFAATQALPAAEAAAGSGPTALLVSDIHNNPISYDLIQRVLPTFRPDFIIDSGDLTDLGTSLESGQVKRIAAYGVPYLFAAGNHEAPPEMAQLAKIANVVILNGQEVVEHGVGIVGVRDPASYSSAPQVRPPQLTADASALRRDVARADARPGAVPVSVAVAHNPVVVTPLAGKVPLVISGHTHTIWIRQTGADLWLNPGTTGASGVRGLTTQTQTPYSMMLVHFAPTGGGRFRVAAVDTIRLSKTGGDLTLQRQTFAAPAATAP